MSRFGSLLVFAFVLGLPGEALASCDDPGGVCIDDANAKWAADGTLSRKQRGKEYKKHRKRKKIPVTLEIEGGRGSVFVDGRFHVWSQSYEMAPGKHDVQVRDGEQVIAQGVLSVPRKSEGLSVTFVHPPG